jgi:hypothetical protein
LYPSNIFYGKTSCFTIYFLTLIISNFGSRRYFIVPANSANAQSPFA